jgi:hypothetical protein
MFRSGSTLAEQILASHPDVTAGGEIAFVPALAARYFGPSLPRWPALEPAGRQQLQTAYARNVATAIRRQGRHRQAARQLPHLGLIKAMFPKARIVHTRRDPIDNCLAVWFLHLPKSMPYALDLLDIAHWYRQHERLMAHWRSLHGADIHEFDYDRLVNEPRPVIEGLLRTAACPGTTPASISISTATAAGRRAPGSCASRSTPARRAAGATTSATWARCARPSATDAAPQPASANR